MLVKVLSLFLFHALFNTAIANELGDGLKAIANNPKLRTNKSPVQTFFINECKSAVHKWYVYWPEERALLMVAEPVDTLKWAEELLMVSDWVNLETHLVNTAEEIGSSTYLETEDVIAQKIACAVRGHSIYIPVLIPGRQNHAG